MKFKKAALGLLALICCGAAIVFTAPRIGVDLYGLFAPDMEEVVARQEYSGDNYRNLSVKGKYVYGIICESHENHETTFRMTEEVTLDEMSDIFTAVRFDYPDRGCLADTYLFAQGGNYYEYTLKYRMDYDECCRRSEKCRDEAERIVSSAQGLSDYEKVLFFHDTLTERTLYSDSLEDDVFTAYGALFDGRANCSGFTAAMGMLLDCAGIENGIVVGEARDKRDGQEDLLHVWNVVTTDKGSGHVDVAWDAGDERDGSSSSHAYFYLSDGEIEKDHVIFDEYKGLCPNSGSSYFNWKGTYFEGWTQSEQRKVGEMLARAASSGEDLEIKFADEAVYASAADYLFNKNGVYDLLYMFCSDREKIPEELTYYVNDDQYTILIDLS